MAETSIIEIQKNMGSNQKTYDLEERTFVFAKNVRLMLKKIPKNFLNHTDIDQLLRSSGSVGANYIEANEALSKRDFTHRMKITRKECKESSYWLELLKEANPKFKEEINDSIQESKELRNIFTSIIEKSK